MTLSVMTPKHLHKINLIDKLVEDEEDDINFLMFSAMRSFRISCELFDGCGVDTNLVPSERA